MLGLRRRCLARRVTSLIRQMSEGQRESPAEMDRRVMKEEERQMQSDFHSVFELLRPAKTPTVDYFRRLNSQFSFTAEALGNYMKEKIVETRVLSQRFLEERHQTLGFDLAAAHFIIARGGRVRFKDHPRWVSQTEDGGVPLPGIFTYGMHVEALDCSGTELVYEGLENFIRLRHLRVLLLRDCQFVDNWCLDRICGEYRDTLQHLDISGCPRITASGLEGVAQLKHLQTLTVERMDHVDMLPYVCLLLEEASPGLHVRGVDTMQPPPLEGPLDELLGGSQGEATTQESVGAGPRSDGGSKPGRHPDPSVT